MAIRLSANIVFKAEGLKQFGKATSALKMFDKFAKDATKSMNNFNQAQGRGSVQANQLKATLGKVNGSFKSLDRKFDSINGRTDKMTGNLRSMNGALKSTVKHSNTTSSGLVKMRTEMNSAGAASGRLNRNLLSSSGAMNRASGAASRFQVGNATVTGGLLSMSSSIGSTARSLYSMALAFGAARGAAALYKSTIDAAMQTEYSSNAVKNIFAQGKGGAAMGEEASKWIQDRQLNSMFTLEDWYSGSKSMASVFKDDMGGFQKSMGIIEKLAFYDPLQGFQGASFSVKEALGDDTMAGFKSVVDRFELNKSVIRKAQEEAAAKGLKGDEARLFAIEAGLNYAGVTDQFINKQQTETALGQLTTFKNKFKTLLMKTGQESLKVMQPNLEKLNKMLTPEKMGELSATWGKRLASLVDHIIDFGEWVADTAPKVKTFWDEVKKTLEPITDKFKDYVGLVKELGTFLSEDVVPAMKDFNALLSDQDTVIGSLYSTLAPLLMTLLIVKSVLNIISKTKLGGFLKGVGGVLALVFSTKLYKNIWKFGRVFGKAFQMKGLSGALKLLGRFGGKAALGALGGWVGIAIVSIIELTSWVIKNKDTVAKWGDKIKEAFSKFAEWISPFVDGAKEAFGAVTGYISDEFAKWKEFFNGEGKPIVENAKKLWSGLTEVASFIGDYLLLTGQGIWAALKTIWSTITMIFTGAWASIVFVVKTAWGLIKALFSVFMDGLRNSLSIFNSLMEGDWKGAWEKIKNTGSVMWDSIKENFGIFFGNLVADAGVWLGSLWDAFETGWGNILDTAKQFATDIINFFTGDKKGEITNAIQSPFLSAFKNIISKVSEVAGRITGLSSLKVAPKIGTYIAEKVATNSHRFGAASIPYDGYEATLHKGERVLTAKENKEYTKMQYSPNSSRASGGVNINRLADSIVIREEADIEKFAKALANEINRAAIAGA